MSEQSHRTLLVEERDDPVTVTPHRPEARKAVDGPGFLEQRSRA